MSFKLRPYQEDIIDRTRMSLRVHNNVLIQSATGSGKTALASKMLGNAAAKGIPSFFMVHRSELIDQTINTFQKVGIPYGVIAAGYNPNPLIATQICSIDTLKRRLDKVPFLPRFIIFDEAHHMASAGWAAVKNYFNCKTVGLSATPERLDGKGLEGYFSDMVCGPTVAWLMNTVDPDTGLTYLCKYRAFEPHVPDMSGVKTRMGDYDQQQAIDIIDKASITGNAINEYNKLMPGRLAVAFCININHSQHVAHQFREAGIHAVHIDGTTPKIERKAAIQSFREGNIKVLTSVDIFGEGFDLPAIEGSILLRPTQSLSLHLQQVGRALRQKAERAIILDHAGNLRRHGLPDDEREWKLEGRIKKKKKKDEEADIINRKCPECYAFHAPAPQCPECGFVYKVVDRTIKHQEGELVEVDPETLRRQKLDKRKEQWACKSEEDFIELGRKRGYKNPEAWAHHQWAYRKENDKKYTDSLAQHQGRFL